MKHYALIQGGIVGPEFSADKVSSEHRITTFYGTKAIFIPVSTEIPLSIAVTANYLFRGTSSWSQVGGGHPHGTQGKQGWGVTLAAKIEYFLESLGSFVDDDGVPREIVYFTVGSTTERKLKRDNDFHWSFRPATSLALETLLGDSYLSRCMTGSTPSERGGILPALKEIYDKRGWK